MAHINYSQLAKVEHFLEVLPEEGIEGINFSPDGPFAIIVPSQHPPLYHPCTVDFLFFSTMQNYGFWYGDDRGYVQPLFGDFHGKEMPQLKGSELLMCALKLALDEDETIFGPSRFAAISPHDLAHLVFADESGPIPFSDFETRFQMTRAYGRWFAENKTTPEKIVAAANISSEPLFTFLENVRQIPGYDADPFEKKNMLLAMALAGRPEKFLKVRDPENWAPVIDYHLMRIALRLGIVELDEEELEDNLNRNWVLPDVEQSIRRETYHAVDWLVDGSGKSPAYIDQIFWWGRKFCPEMTPPDCDACIFKNVCLKRIALFQPVFRTTAY